jgi:hypothetical protein
MTAWLPSTPDGPTTADYGHTNTELPAIAAAIMDFTRVAVVERC